MGPKWDRPAKDCAVTSWNSTLATSARLGFNWDQLESALFDLFDLILPGLIRNTNYVDSGPGNVQIYMHGEGIRSARVNT